MTAPPPRRFVVLHRLDLAVAIAAAWTGATPDPELSTIEALEGLPFAVRQRALIAADAVAAYCAQAIEDAGAEVEVIQAPNFDAED